MALSSTPKRRSRSIGYLSLHRSYSRERLNHLHANIAKDKNKMTLTDILENDKQFQIISTLEGPKSKTGAAENLRASGASCTPLILVEWF